MENNINVWIYTLEIVVPALMVLMYKSIHFGFLKRFSTSLPMILRECVYMTLMNILILGMVHTVKFLKLEQLQPAINDASFSYLIFAEILIKVILPIFEIVMKMDDTSLLTRIISSINDMSIKGIAIGIVKGLFGKKEEKPKKHKKTDDEDDTPVDKKKKKKNNPHVENFDAFPETDDIEDSIILNAKNDQQIRRLLESLSTKYGPVDSKKEHDTAKIKKPTKFNGDDDE